MTCLRIAETKNFSFCSKNIQNKKTCAIQCALITIALAGVGISICAIVSYLPPGAGYAGGSAAFIACISLVVLQVKKRKNPSEHLRASQQDPSAVHVGNRHAEGVEQSHSELPDEIYLKIFSNCHAKELLIAGQVNRKWKNLTSDNLHWKAICEQETRCPPVDPSHSNFSWKKYFLDFQSLPKRIRESQLPPTVKDFPSLPGYVSIESFLKTSEYCFFCFSNASFEIWDSSLSACLLKTSIRMRDHIRIKMHGDLVYVVGNNYNQRFAHVFNVKTQLSSSYYLFEHCVPQHAPYTYPFEINEKGVFLGQEDGVIAVWDLSYETPYWRPWAEKQVMGCYYSDSPNAYWSDESEKRWQNTFTDGEKGARARADMACSRENFLKMKQRKMLQGHTEEITSLRITDHFLFSGSRDKTIRQWDLQTYQCLRTISIDIPNVKGSIFAKDLQVSGKWIFGVVHEQIYQWDISSGECITSFALTDYHESFQVLGNLLVCLSHQYEPNEPEKKWMIRVFDLVHRTMVKTFAYSSKDVQSHCQLTEHQLMALGDSRSKLITWDF